MCVNAACTVFKDPRMEVNAVYCQVLSKGGMTRQASGDTLSSHVLGPDNVEGEHIVGPHGVLLHLCVGPVGYNSLQCS